MYLFHDGQYSTCVMYIYLLIVVYLIYYGIETDKILILCIIHHHIVVQCESAMLSSIYSDNIIPI